MTVVPGNKNIACIKGSLIMFRVKERVARDLAGANVHICAFDSWLKLKLVVEC
jgi:hypothetical protein